MGKKSRVSKNGAGEGSSAPQSTLTAAPKVVDPALVALFTSSAAITAKASPKLQRRISTSVEDDPTNLDSDPNNLDSVQQDSESFSETGASMASEVDGPESTGRIEVPAPRKRKRKDNEDNLEEVYMRRLAKEEDKETARQSKNPSDKRRKTRHETEISNGQSASKSDNDDNDDNDEDNTSISGSSSSSKTSTRLIQHEIIQHETISSSPANDLEKSNSTIFLSNISTTAITTKSAHRALLAHLSSHLSSLPNTKDPKTSVTHKLLTLRFRSTPLPPNIPKRAAFVTKALMPTTTRSTNAYAVYSTPLAAREAVKRLNGTIVLDRHIHVDGVAHPSVVDHKRCVFVGNLGFVDDESAIRAAEEEQSGKKPAKKSKESSDVEEGLWRVFGNAGTIESVRVVRDKVTRVGKGFAYVQFKDANAVERALLYNGQKHPPMLPRTLRVTRAKAITKKAYYAKSGSRVSSKATSSATGNYKAKPSSQSLSLAGRAGKLLGKAGAARLRAGDGKASGVGGVKKTPEKVVFEGYRASRNQGKSGLGGMGKGRGKGKPTTRSSRRGAAFKVKGGK